MMKSFFVLGVNHHSASVELREKVAFNAERLAMVLAQQANQPILNDLVVVSTCNRTEIYAITSNVKDILAWFAQVNALALDELNQHIYYHENAQAVTHLMRVASGLDSLMLGEPQILGQVKNALNCSKEAGTVSKELNRIFEYAFFAAKKVRSETEIGAHAISMGYSVAQLALQVFHKAQDLTILIVAAGEMNSLVARHLVQMQVKRMIICNRTRERAELLASELRQRIDVEVIDFTDLKQHLHRADVVSSCTGSLQPVIFYDDIKSALKQRRYQPMLLVDLAVPRDIDAEIEQLDEVYLYGIDDLQGVIDENLAQRRQAAVEAEFMVNHLATQFVTQQKAHQAGSIIHQYRQHGQRMADMELANALMQIQQGESVEQVLQQFAYRLSHKLLHPTSKLLRQSAQQDNPEIYQWIEQEMSDILEHGRETKIKYQQN